MKDITLVKSGGFIRFKIGTELLDTKLDDTIIRALRMNKNSGVSKQILISTVEKKLSGEEVKLDHSDISKIVALVKAELNMN